MQTINFCFRSTALSFFVFNLAKFGTFFALFGPFGLLLGFGSGSKTFLGPTYVDNQLWFWKQNPIFLFFIWPHLGNFCTFFWPFGTIFLALWSYFWGRDQIQKQFLKPTCSQLILVLEVQPYLFVFNSAKFRAFFALLVLFLGLGSGSKTFLGPTFIE